MATYTYNPAVFDAPDPAAAARIILTEADRTTAERWRTETPGLAALAGASLRLSAKSAVLDYGCGIGRMSKALIERHACRVLGVDTSARMREMALPYVESSQFEAAGPDALAVLEGQFDAAISIWVLQHCLNPDEDIERIRRSLRPGGRLMVVNTNHRCVPVVGGKWFDDGFDMAGRLASVFTELQRGELPAALVGAGVAGYSFWGVYEAA